MARIYAWVLGAVLVLAVFGWQVERLTRADPLPYLDSLGGDFRLQSTLGGSQQLSDFHGEIVLLNFGYTSCPMVCPVALARMRDVVAAVNAHEVPVRAVFVTLDPERDTMERLEPYIEFWGDAFVGMTGSVEEIGAATAPYKVFYEKDEIVSELEYSITHSSHIYVLDPQGNVRTTFAQSITVPTMIEKVHQLQEEAG
ncbi:MAG: SCO family protein [Pseudomonadales bacterium]|jgi:protein SCO1/2|nr:SCO family protein [Pseudomonadales bacterium]MDP6472820.1 SCO family protein [Pseudomonadales bacterium]MDP6828036.1 SCO family protein [Pseudomonadales bacterium]